MSPIVGEVDGEGVSMVQARLQGVGIVLIPEVDGGPPRFLDRLTEDPSGGGYVSGGWGMSAWAGGPGASGDPPPNLISEPFPGFPVYDYTLDVLTDQWWLGPGAGDGMSVGWGGAPWGGGMLRPT